MWNSPRQVQAMVRWAFVGLFVILPLVEFALLIEVGRRVGTIMTLFLVVLTGVAGATLARGQGFRVWRQIQWDLQEGRMPADALLQGMMVFIGGLLLLLPGFLTDLVGILLLLPGTRAALLRGLKARLARWLEEGTVRIYFWG